MGLNFVFKIYLSYHIDKSDIGIFYTFMDMVSIGVMVFAGFKDSLIRAFDRDNFQNILYWYSYIFWGLSAIVLTIELIYYHFSHFKYPVYTLVSILFFNLLSIFLSYLNASFKGYKIMLFENLIQALGVILSFTILSQYIDNIDALIYAFILSFIVKIIYIWLFSPIQWDKHSSEIKEVKPFITNTLFSSGMYFLSGFFISMSSLVILNLFDDIDFLSEFQIVIKSIFFSLVAVFVYPLNSFTFPQLSKLISEKQIGEILRIEQKFKRYLIVFFILIILGSFFTKFIIAMVFPKEYIGGYFYLNLMLPLLPFIAYTTFALNIIKGFDRFDLALYVRLLGSVVFFISVFIFYLLGFEASCVVYSLDMSFLAMFILVFYYKKRLLL